MPDFISSSFSQADFARVQSSAQGAIQKLQGIAQQGAGAQQARKRNLQAEEIDEVSKGFETYFLHVLIKEMRKTINKADFIEGDSSAMKMYEDMFDERLAEALAERDMTGIGRMVKEELEKLQEGVYQPDSPELQQKLAERAKEFLNPGAAQNTREKTDRTAGPNSE